MAVVKMQALTLVGPNEEMETVARDLILFGGFHPLPLDLLVTDRVVRSRITTSNQENPYDELLATVASMWRVAGEKIPDPEPVPVDQNVTLMRLRSDVETIRNRLEVWSERLEILKQELDQLEAARIYLEPLFHMGRNLTDLTSTEMMSIFFGVMTADNYERLTETVAELAMAVFKLTQHGDDVWVLVLAGPAQADRTKALLDSVYFRAFSMKELADKLGESNHLEKVIQRIENHERAIKGLTNAAQNVLKNNYEWFNTLYSRIYTMQRVYDLCMTRGQANSTYGLYVLSGWIPEDMLAGLRVNLERLAPRTAIMVQELKNAPIRGISIPTKLKNLPIIRDFQDIVAIYSLPSYGETDPSLIVALTFILFFGFMFGDVGHGILLFLGASLLQKKGIFKKSLAHVIKSASVSSMVFGVLYGSVFGMEDKIIKHVWLSPMHQTNTLLSIAVYIGIGFVSLGLLLNMIQQYRRGDFGRLLFDGNGLAGLAFYWLAALVGYAYLTGTKLPIPTTYILWGLLGLVLLMLFRDVLARVVLRQRHDDAHKESVALIFFEMLHSLMGFLSNSASFVRLAAFALNHVGLSLAVFMLADMVHALPGGMVLQGIVLVLGNLVIVVLEGLIVFIQILRLEYYEFFSKFYQGGGTPFKPIQWRRPEGKAIQYKSQPAPPKEVGN